MLLWDRETKEVRMVEHLSAEAREYDHLISSWGACNGEYHELKTDADKVAYLGAKALEASITEGIRHEAFLVELRRLKPSAK